MNTLAFGYVIPAIRAYSGLAPVRQCSCRAYNEKSAQLVVLQPVTLILAEREGFEPTTLTAYISATSLSKFQIGNETVTIFRCWACPTLTAVCLPNFRVQRYGFLLKLANI